MDVKSHSSSKIDFKGEIKSRKRRDDIKIAHKVEGDVLKVWIDRPRSLSGSFNGYLNFLVPKSTNVVVNNSSGSVSVVNIGQAKVKLAASSGSIYAENIESDLSASASSGSLKILGIAGNLKSVTSSGSQNITNIGGNLSATLSSGSIKATDVKGSVKSTTSSGSHSINNVGNGVAANASSGSIKIDNANGAIVARTSSGGIKIANTNGSVDLASSSGGQYGTGVMLTGDSSFKSSSGGIKMVMVNKADDLSFDLVASLGSINAKGSSGKKKLVINKGGIKITGRSSSGSQSYQ